jgi:hypothetical protein
MHLGLLLDYVREVERNELRRSVTDEGDESDGFERIDTEFEVGKRGE